MKNMVFAVALLFAGCCHNLQADYVVAMEGVHEALLLDVKHGLYNPDKHGKKTLEKFGELNADYRARLEKDGKLDPKVAK